MHLEGPDGRNEGHRRGNEPRGPALHVEELFHPNVGPKASLCDDKSVLADELEGHFVGHDGRVADCNVGKRPCVHQHGGSFHRLHQRRVHHVLEQNCQRPGDAEVIGRHRVAIRVGRKDDLAEAVLEVVRVGRQCKDCHDLRRHRNIKLRLPSPALLSGALPDSDLAEEAVVGVQDAAPRNGGLVNVESGKLDLLLLSQLCWIGLLNPEPFEPADLDVGELVFLDEALEKVLVLLVRLVERPCVNRGRHEIVGSRDGVDVAGEVQIELVHGDDLGIAAAGGPALDPKRWALRRLSETRKGGSTEGCTKRLCQPDRRG
mmetsp:Transcript_27402/g.71923  ORF Transcript_27402/g.71923 Transcript_27402/m.71923 type:complete len:317 (+) Transcript_27402:847-1797(+)